MKYYDREDVGGVVGLAFEKAFVETAPFFKSDNRSYA